jgi:hypothetical protein
MPYYVNDTVEVFRSCPTYGSMAARSTLTVVGRNFRNTTLNFCRVTLCLGSDLGPYSCVNSDGSTARLSNYSTVVPAMVLSKTRVLCDAPELIFNQTLFDSWSSALGSCVRVGGVRKYRRLDDSGHVEDLTGLFVPCKEAELAAGYCTNVPEHAMKLNPCFAAEAMVEVSNDGLKWSGDGLFVPHTVLDRSVYANHKDLLVPPTFAVYSYVLPSRYPSDPLVLDMDRDICMRTMFAEEAARTREEGWLMLPAMRQARISIDLRHLPDEFLHGEHYRVAVFTRPSRCDVLTCDSGRNRLPPEEYLPCTMPMDLPAWMTDPSVKKNQVLNLTMLALDDMIFKVEIHVMHGMFAAYADYLRNTTIVEHIEPARTNVTTGLIHPESRQLSPYVSYEERRVVMEYFFVAVYFQDDTSTVSAPLNLPPRYAEYEKGRALLGFNVSVENTGTPSILDKFEDVVKGEWGERHAVVVIIP